MSPQAVQDAVPPEEPTLADLMDLMPELRSMVIRGLTRDAARNLASTGSAALHAVLEARTDLRFFKLHRALAPSIAHLRFSAGAISQAQVNCSHGKWVIRVSLPWHAAPRVAAEQQQCQHADAAVPANTALFWFSPAAIATTVQVYTGGDWSGRDRAAARDAGTHKATGAGLHPAWRLAFQQQLQ